MDLQLCYNASEDGFPLPRHIKNRYGPFGFPAQAAARRPYFTSNIAMGLDGRASFRELPGRGGAMARSFQGAAKMLADGFSTRAP